MSKLFPKTWWEKTCYVMKEFLASLGLYKGI